MPQPQEHDPDLHDPDEGEVTLREMARHPAAVRLAGARTLGDLSAHVAFGALLLLVYELTGSAFGPAVLFAVRAVPALAVSTVLSGWLDVPPRRPAMVGLSCLMTGLLTAVALAPTLPVVLGAVGLMAGAQTALVSVGSGAIADAVPPRMRRRLLGVIFVSDQAAQVVGLLAGASIAVLVGPRPALAGGVVLTAVASVLLASAPLGSRTAATSGPRPSPWQGFQVIASHATLRLVAVVVWVTMLASLIPETLAVVLDDGPAVAWLLASSPAGGVLGAWLVSRTAALERMSGQLAWSAALGLALIVTGVLVAVDAPIVAVIAGNALIGAAGGWVVAAQATFLRLAPAASMAQVTAAMVATLIVLESVGALLAGALAANARPEAGYLTVGVTVVVVTAVVHRLHVRARRRPVHAPR